MKRLAIALVVMTSTAAYAQGYDEPFVPIPLIPEEKTESLSEMWDRQDRESKERMRQLREDSYMLDQEFTNQQIRNYIQNQNQRQKDIDYERRPSMFGN